MESKKDFFSEGRNFRAKLHLVVNTAHSFWAAGVALKEDR